MDIFENITVIVCASHGAPAVSLSSPLSVIQIFWSVFLYTVVALTDLMGCRCGWLMLRFPLKELHIYVSRHRTTQFASRCLLRGRRGEFLKQPPAKRTSVQHQCVWTVHRFFNVLQNDLIFLSSTQLSLTCLCIQLYSYIKNRKQLSLS